jgi:hypothetical protein
VEPQAAPAPTSHFYLLSRPVENRFKLGPTAKALHYVLETGAQFAKGYLMYRQTGNAAAGWTLLATELPKVPVMIQLQSLGDLQFRAWWANQRQLHQLASFPDVDQAMMLSTGTVKYQGPMASEQFDQGLAFIETSKPLSPDEAVSIGSGAQRRDLGHPVAIPDPSAVKLRLNLTVGGQSAGDEWSPSIKDVLESGPDSRGDRGLLEKCDSRWLASSRVDGEGQRAFQERPRARNACHSRGRERRGEASGSAQSRQGGPVVPPFDDARMDQKAVGASDRQARTGRKDDSFGESPTAGSFSGELGPMFEKFLRSIHYSLS